MSDVIIKPENGFVSPAVPTQRTFKKVKDVVKALITKANPDTATSIDFGDLQVAVNVENHQLTVTLNDNPVNNYVIANEANSIVFTYTDVDFNALMTSQLGFAATYFEADKDKVIAALPVGFDHEYNTETQVLTVTVSETTSTFDFTEDNTTLATALFTGKTFNISFVDEAIKLDEKLINTNLELALDDLLEETVASGNE